MTGSTENSLSTCWVETSFKSTALEAVRVLFVSIAGPFRCATSWCDLDLTFLSDLEI